MINLDNTENSMIEYPNLKSILRLPTNWQLDPTDTERINLKNVTFKIEE